MPERLRPADYRFLAVCVILLAACVWFSARYFYRAFPEASIDFRVTRDQARELGERLLASRGLRIDGYRRASRFSYDDGAKTFLERTAGLERANRLMGGPVRLWRWSWRWFRPLQKEEFRVDITTAGEPAGFRHEIPEAQALPSLPVPRARALAEDFLRSEMHRDPAALDFMDAASISRPARTDQVFTWKQRGFDLQDATYRYEVTVLGNQVGGYREYLKVPEKWERSYQSLRSRNLTAQTIDAGFLMLLAIGLLITIVLRVRHRDVRWRLAVAVGGTGALLYVLANWNAQPLAEFSYPTTDSWASFVVQELLRNVTGALGSGGLLFILTAGAEPLYRERYRSHLPLDRLFNPGGLGSRQFFLGTILGITLAAIFVAYQTAFYLAASRLGAWSPADVPYDDLLNTRLPWLFVLLGGFLPAVSEEFLFRMFAIPFLSKLLRWTPAAVVVAAFIWGFGHAGYPQQPFWIRGVEVGIGGVTLGLIMLCWGILPTLVWHYSVDAMYTALLLVRSHHPYFVWSGAASAGIMVLPVLIAGIGYLRRGGFVPAGEAMDPPPVDAPEPAAPAPGPVPALAACPTWPRRRRMAAVLAIVSGGVLVARLPVRDFGSQPRFAVDPAAARAAALQFARAQGFAPGGYRTVAVPMTAWEDQDIRLAVKYFVERRDLNYTAHAFRQFLPLYGWQVRFFKPLEHEEMEVLVNPENGRVFAFAHELPEDRPGADLDPDRASALAAHATGLPSLEGFILKESKSERKKVRRDYTLVWEAPPGDPRHVDDARYRVRVTLAGDRIASFRSYWKLPEAFERVRERRNALSYALLVLRLGLGGSLLVLGAWVLIERTRGHDLPWGRALWIAAPPGLMTLAAMAMSFPLLFSQYPTTFSLEAFSASMGVGLFVGATAMFLALACAAALIVALRSGAQAIRQSAYRRLAGIDAVLSAGLAVLIAVALDRLRWLLIARFHAQALLSAEARASYATLFPAAAAIAGACQQTMFALAALLLVAMAYRRLDRWPGAALAAALIAAAGLVPGTIHTAGEFFLFYAIRLLYVAAAVLFVKYIARDNDLACALTAWTLALLGKTADLLSQPAATLQWQGAILLVLLGATLAWTLAPVIFSRAPAPPAGRMGTAG